MKQPQHFKLDVLDAVATITLSRPERLNALTFAVYGELRECFDELDGERSIRAIVLTGEGRGFCSGGDVDAIIGPLFSRDGDGLLDFTRITGALIRSIRQCRTPVIAALNGTVAGAGAVIASACDLRIATEHAKIAFLFPKVGLCGADMGAAWLLPRLIGLSQATELLLDGEFIDAKRALAIGLYHRVVAAQDLLPSAQAWAKKLADGPAFAHRMTKEMLNREAHMDLSTALEAEAQAQAICMQHPDFRLAYEAVKSKQAPIFTRAGRSGDKT
jgi:enoyl-CoA hydratase/carnithine racemase